MIISKKDQILSPFAAPLRTKRPRGRWPKGTWHCHGSGPNCRWAAESQSSETWKTNLQRKTSETSQEVCACAALTSSIGCYIFVFEYASIGRISIWLLQVHNFSKSLHPSKSSSPSGWGVTLQNVLQRSVFAVQKPARNKERTGGSKQQKPGNSEAS